MLEKRKHDGRKPLHYEGGFVRHVAIDPDAFAATTSPHPATNP